VEADDDTVSDSGGNVNIAANEAQVAGASGDINLNYDGDLTANSAIFVP